MALTTPLPSMLPDNLSAPVFTSEMFSFERSFDYDEFHSWIVRHWTISFVYSAVYVVLIFAARRYMAQRARFELRLPLAAWSGMLAIFSIAGAVRTIPELMHLLRWHGFEESVCRCVFPLICIYVKPLRSTQPGHPFVAVSPGVWSSAMVTGPIT